MDSIADMLVRMRNAMDVCKENVDIPHSKVKEEIAKIMLAEGYLAKLDVHARMNRKYLRLSFKYGPNKLSVISGLRRISRSGRRLYVSKDKIPYVQSGFGTAIISTSKGLMTDETARAQQLGGEVICQVW